MSVLLSLSASAGIFCRDWGRGLLLLTQSVPSFCRVLVSSLVRLMVSFLVGLALLRHGRPLRRGFDDENPVLLVAGIVRVVNLRPTRLGTGRRVMAGQIRYVVSFYSIRRSLHTLRSRSLKRVVGRSQVRWEKHVPRHDGIGGCSGSNRSSLFPTRVSRWNWRRDDRWGVGVDCGFSDGGISEFHLNLDRTHPLHARQDLSVEGERDGHADRNESNGVRMDVGNRVRRRRDRCVGHFFVI